MEKYSREIEYQKEGAAFKVVLTVNSPDIFEKALQQKNIRDKKGEEWLSALIAYIRTKSAVLVVDCYKDGERHDGLNGEPAVQIFSDNGKIVANKHFQRGRLSDGANGEPAVQMFDDRFRLVHAVSYKNGEQVKVLSELEREGYMFQWAQKNAGKAPADNKKPHSPTGGMKLG